MVLIPPLPERRSDKESTGNNRHIGCPIGLKRVSRKSIRPLVWRCWPFGKALHFKFSAYQRTGFVLNT